MESTEIRTAPYMRLIIEEECKAGGKYFGGNVVNVEFYNRGNEWYVIETYDDGEEVASKLNENFIPGGWMDNGQAIGKYINYCKNR